MSPRNPTEQQPGDIPKDVKQRISGPTVVMATLFIVCFGITAVYWASNRAMKQPVPAIVVLPFEKPGDYFAQGFTIELIDSLSKVEKLRVTSWSSALPYQGKAGNLQDLRNKLQAGSVVDGSLTRQKDRIQIKARLVDTVSGQVIWSETYDTPAGEIFRIQEEIAKSIVYSLKVQLRVDPQRILVPPRTESITAYDHYLRARSLHNQSSLTDSSIYARKAIEEDPKYAPAYGLAAMNLVLAKSNDWPEVKRLAQAAIAIDASSAESHAALGAALAQSDPKAAEVEWQRAIQWSPGSAELHAAYALLFLVPQKRLEEAEYEAKRALVLDPLSALGKEALANSQARSTRAALAPKRPSAASSVRPQNGTGRPV